MYGKNFMIFYIILLVVSLFFIIFGIVYYREVIHNNVNKRISLSKDNTQFWNKLPYGKNNFKVNITFFDWINHEDIFSTDQSKKVKVKEILMGKVLQEEFEIKELARKEYHEGFTNTETVDIEVIPKRTFQATSEITKPFKGVNIGAFKKWNYVKGSNQGTNAIKILYKQLTEIENTFYQLIMQKSFDIIKSEDDFKTNSIIFNQISDSEIPNDVRVKLYSKNNLSFLQSKDFFSIFYECTDSYGKQNNPDIKVTLDGKCLVFNELYPSITNEIFSKLSTNIKKFVKETLNIKSENKQNYAISQWGIGDSYPNSVFNKNSTYFGMEIFKFAKEKYGEFKFDLTFEQSKKLIDYSFVVKNEKDKNYIATNDEKSILFDKEFIDGIYSGEKSGTDIPIESLSRDEKYIIEKYINEVLFNEDDLVVDQLTSVSLFDPETQTELSQEIEQSAYIKRELLSVENKKSILINEIKAGKYNTKKRIIIELAEFTSSFFYQYSQKVGINLFLYYLSRDSKSKYFATKPTCVDSIKFISDVTKLEKICENYNNLKEESDIKKLILGCLYNDPTEINILERILVRVNDISQFLNGFYNALSGIIDDINKNIIKGGDFNYREFDFTKYGLKNLLTGEYTTQTPFKKLSDLNPLEFEKVTDYNSFCKSTNTENEFIKDPTLIEKYTGFDRTKGIFSIDFFIQNLLINLNKIDSKPKLVFNSENFINYIRKLYIDVSLNGLVKYYNVQEEDIFNYKDKIITDLKEKSLLIGGNRVLKDEINLGFDYEKYTKNQFTFFTGLNNTVLTRRLISLSLDKTYQNKIISIQKYYAGNNQPLKDIYRVLDDTMNVRRGLNSTDGVILPGKINQIKDEDLDVNEKNDKTTNFYFNELFAKIHLNSTNSEGGFSGGITIQRYDLNNTLQYRLYNKQSNLPFINLNEVIDYPLVAGVKYFNNSKYKDYVEFQNDESKNEKTKETTPDPYLESWVEIHPASGLTINSMLNFMYSIMIEPDELFALNEAKVVPVYFKSKQFNMDKIDVEAFLDGFLVNRFLSQMFLFIGVGLLVFSLLMIFFAIFRPTPKLKSMDSTVGTTGSGYIGIKDPMRKSDGEIDKLDTINENPKDEELYFNADNEIK